MLYRFAGGLCIGEKAIYGRKIHFCPFRMRHGTAKAGGDGAPGAHYGGHRAVQYLMGRHLSHGRLAVRRIFDETVFRDSASELLEAARIDGAGELRTFWDIVLPIVKPGVGALAIFTFVNTWNDYFMQLIMLKSSDAITVSLGIARLQSEFATNYGLMMAGATLGAVPIVAVFICFQKYFTQGITMGAVKG